MNAFCRGVGDLGGSDRGGRLGRIWKRKGPVFPGSKLAPGPLFDAAWYIKTQQLADDEDAAWKHFLETGWKVGAQPCQAFDTAWYIAQYHDVYASNMNPLEHFLAYGCSEMRQPHPLFDTKWYAEKNADVVDVGMNPLIHYLQHGFFEGRDPIEFFDDFWYLSSYKDVARSKLLPIYHYCKFGIAEGRNPSSDFDTKHYLERNLDIDPSKVNPLFHYVRFGRFEGRQSRAPVAPGYKEWIQVNEARGYGNSVSIRDTISLFKYLPTFSIVVPTYNTPTRYLNAFIASVRNQIYPHWQLCIVDDASPDPAVKVHLERICKMDRRIQVAYNKTNLHIAEATNVALGMATGDYICLMDHDDEIASNALFEFALKLNVDPQLDMIYSDEDKMNLSGDRYEPFFKPDWSPEYLESCMYTAHFACYRKSIVDKVGGFRKECNGAQDYDFVLRFTQRTSKIGHIPKILYHWRAIPGSTAASMDNKDYVIGAAVRALTDYLEREGSPGTVKANRYAGCFDLLRDVKGKPKVSIVIPTAGRDGEVRGEKLDLIVNCVKSVCLNSTYSNTEIIIVHNGDMRRSSLEALSKFDVKYVEYKGFFNVARKMNQGAKIASGEYLIFLNDDIEVVEAGWIEALLSIGQKPGVGAVGAKLLFDNGQVQHAGVTFCESLPDHVLRGSSEDDPGYFFSTVASRNYLAVTGACILCAKKTFNEVNGFDEDFAVNYNDIDFCLKLVDIGLRIVYAPQAKLYHFESRNRERTVDDSEISLFLEKWRNKAAVDPYYSRYFESRPPEFKLVVDDGSFGELRSPPQEAAPSLDASSGNATSLRTSHRR
ncbi:hypothetical protein RHAL1_00279 [Beijerinckiaceae bacterium RH AL1]|nr:hypothetical protein RHAL8_00267 [Beijerinckiaceae bacterium RH AL8]VVB42600.1 hypothetical protein RHCH11_RHCH11_00268 [Beijerinckiaceae bacterium RH CH11]VVC53398.1 hypothetical protein RHAL1_00279 [Beijerinckiaceae bacterium RH AL1]